MFDINFISNSGMQNEESDEKWSFLKEKIIIPEDKENKNVIIKTSLFDNEVWKSYLSVLIGFGLIFIMSIMNTQPVNFDSEKILNQVLDLMIDSDYSKEFNLKNIEFNQNQIFLLFELVDVSTIHDMENIYALSEKISYEIYKKDSINYLNILFPWNVSLEGGNFENIKSIMDKIIFSKEVVVEEVDNMIYFHAKLSDIVTFLLNMTDDNQIQKFSFSISQNQLNDYKMILYSNL